MQNKQGRNYGVVHRTTVKATCSPDIIRLAWIAGFLEGEGCFYGTSKGTSHSIVAVQKDPESLMFLQQYLGGSVNKISTNERDYWRWLVSGSRARGIMMTIYLMMSVRRREQIVGALT